MHIGCVFWLYSVHNLRHFFLFILRLAEIVPCNHQWRRIHMLLSTLHTLIHFHLPDMVQDVDPSAHFSDGETEERAVPCGGQLGCVPDPCQWWLRSVVSLRGSHQCLKPSRGSCFTFPSTSSEALHCIKSILLTPTLCYVTLKNLQISLIGWSQSHKLILNIYMMMNKWTLSSIETSHMLGWSIQYCNLATNKIQWFLSPAQCFCLFVFSINTSFRTKHNLVDVIFVHDFLAQFFPLVVSSVFFLLHFPIAKPYFLDCCLVGEF